MHSDFSDLLSTFNAHGVDYLVVGDHALAAFGAPLHDLTEQDLCTPGLIFQIGVPPVRVDVLTSIDGVDFEEAFRSRVAANLGGTEVPVLSRHHLIVNKSTAGRKQDLADVEWLEKNGGDDQR